MFSYRHGYHAGNHADVLKHLCQMLILEKLKTKPKPFIYMDTHSGAGKYDLTSEFAVKTDEFSEGVDRLLAFTSQNAQLQAYQQLLTQYRQHNQYPGSPEIARTLLREQDHICLMEWHNQEIENLKSNMARGNNTAIHHRNGFEGVVALTPPDPKRGLVLMDPSYEVPQDYTDVVKSLKKASQRWPTGIFALWYPLLAKSRDKSQQMLQQLQQLEVNAMLDIQLCVKEQHPTLGMHGSGMLIINPPWQLDEHMQALLPELSQCLAVNGQGGWHVNWLKQGE